MLLQLQPSHAGAWRLLGTLQAEHGGAVQAASADEALRRALALEPSWDDLRSWPRVAAKRAPVAEGREAAARRPPSAKAQELFARAQRRIGVESPELAEAEAAPTRSPTRPASSRRRRRCSRSAPRCRADD